MSSEISTSNSETHEPLSPFLPFFLIAGSFLVFLGWQVNEIIATRSKLRESIAAREAVTAQAVETHKRLEKLAVELVEVSKTSSEARRVVAQYNIQYTPSPKAASGEAK